MGKLNDLTGQKFNRLTALSFYGFSTPKPPRDALWLFRCDCGAEKIASGLHEKSKDGINEQMLISNLRTESIVLETFAS